MYCPTCGCRDTKVIDSRAVEDGKAIRRRRSCPECGYRFTTYERASEKQIIVLKNDKSSEPFDRDKLLRGLMRASAKRDIPVSKLNAIIDDIENELRNSNSMDVSSKIVGDMVLARLKDVDDLAYIRFASVYKDFKSIDEFADALKGMS